MEKPDKYASLSDAQLRLVLQQAQEGYETELAKHEALQREAEQQFERVQGFHTTVTELKEALRLRKLQRLIERLQRDAAQLAQSPDVTLRQLAEVLNSVALSQYYMWIADLVEYAIFSHKNEGTRIRLGGPQGVLQLIVAPDRYYIVFGDYRLSNDIRTVYNGFTRTADDGLIVDTSIIAFEVTAAEGQTALRPVAFLKENTPDRVVSGNPEHFEPSADTLTYLISEMTAMLGIAPIYLGGLKVSRVIA